KQNISAAMISRQEMESVRSYEMRVSFVDASSSRSILTLNDEPTTPNLRPSFKCAARGRDRYEWRGGPGENRQRARRRSKQSKPRQMRSDRAGSLYKAGWPSSASAAM